MGLLWVLFSLEECTDRKRSCIANDITVYLKTMAQEENVQCTTVQKRDIVISKVLEMRDNYSEVTIVR